MSHHKNWKDEIDKNHKGQTGFFKQIEKISNHVKIKRTRKAEMLRRLEENRQSEMEKEESRNIGGTKF
jgi:hypothetical protein